MRWNYLIILLFSFLVIVLWAHKNRIWDGKIRLFNSRSRTIYSGATYIKKFCGEREYKLDISPDVNITHSLSLVEAVGS